MDSLVRCIVGAELLPEDGAFGLVVIELSVGWRLISLQNPRQGNGRPEQNPAKEAASSGCCGQELSGGGPLSGEQAEGE